MGLIVTQIAMGESVYLSKNLTADQLRFMKLLDEHELLYFRMHEIEQQLGTMFDNLNEVLENLVQKQLLWRLEKGKYCRFDFTDTHVLASFVSQGGVVGYWSALHLHGLTERFPNKEFIKTTQRKRPTKLFGTPVQFVTVKPYKLQEGNIRQGYGDRAYPLTDVEMTLVDCFDQPRYAGDWPDLLKAFHMASLDSPKLIRYAQNYHNIALIKRMGFLAELLQKEGLEEFITFAQKQVNQKYTLFEPGGPNEGKLNHRWKLRMNMTESAILDLVNSPY